MLTRTQKTKSNGVMGMMLNFSRRIIPQGSDHNVSDKTPSPTESGKSNDDNHSQTLATITSDHQSIKDKVVRSPIRASGWLSETVDTNCSDDNNEDNAVTPFSANAFAHEDSQQVQRQHQSPSRTGVSQTNVTKVSPSSGTSVNSKHAPTSPSPYITPPSPSPSLPSRSPARANGWLSNHTATYGGGGDSKTGDDGVMLFNTQDTVDEYEDEDARPHGDSRSRKRVHQEGHKRAGQQQQIQDGGYPSIRKPDVTASVRSVNWDLVMEDPSDEDEALTSMFSDRGSRRAPAPPRTRAEWVWSVVSCSPLWMNELFWSFHFAPRIVLCIVSVCVCARADSHWHLLHVHAWLARARNVSTVNSFNGVQHAAKETEGLPWLTPPAHLATDGGGNNNTSGSHILLSFPWCCAQMHLCRLVWCNVLSVFNIFCFDFETTVMKRQYFPAQEPQFGIFVDVIEWLIWYEWEWITKFSKATISMINREFGGFMARECTKKIQQNERNSQ